MHPGRGGTGDQEHQELSVQYGQVAYDIGLFRYTGRDFYRSVSGGSSASAMADENSSTDEHRVKNGKSCASGSILDSRRSIS